MDPYVMQLSANFLEVAGRHSYEMISQKMKLAKEKDKMKEQQIVYEEIINDLMQDKLELESVAGEYKKLYETLTISDDDIEHLQNTIESLVGIVVDYGFVDADKVEDMPAILDLFNKDTLKTAQLLGFNYKEAIGVPFTEVVSSHILSLQKNTPRTNKGQNKGNKGR